MMAAADQNWKAVVRAKLSDVFKDNPTDLARIFFFLDEEDKAYRDNVDCPYVPHWISLKDTLNSHEAFTMFALQLSEKAAMDHNYQEWLKVRIFFKFLTIFCPF